MTRLHDHRLVVYLYAALTGDDRAEARRRLETVWGICADKLGMTVAATDSIRIDPPPVADQPRTGTVAGRRALADPLREAWWDNAGDTACVSITLAGVAASWADLYDTWTAAVSAVELDALLGYATVFTALVDCGSTPAMSDDSATEVTGERVSGDLAAAFAHDLPTAVKLTDTAWAATAVDLGAGVVARQISPTRSHGPSRVLVVTSVTDRDAELGRWIWAPDLGRLGRYLLHAAKLRYQVRVLHRERDGLHEQRLRISDKLDRLQDAALTLGDGPDADVQSVQHEVSLLQADRSGIIEALIQARRMRHTVQIAQANMTALLPTIGATDPGRAAPTFAIADRAMAIELDQDLHDEAAYLDAAAQRAQHIADIADREITARAHRHAEAARHRQERFALTQTAIIGTVLMALTAFQTLGYEMPLPGRTKPAIIATLGAAVLWLSIVALRMATPADEPHPRLVRQLPELTAFGALTAAVAWLSMSLAAGRVRWITRDEIATLAAASAAFLFGAIVAWAWYRGRRR